MFRRISAFLTGVTQRPAGAPQTNVALQRIAEAKRTGATELDLGGLGLTEIPEAVAELPMLKRLYLGQDAEARKEPTYPKMEDVKKACNTVRALPARICTALPNLEHLDLAFNAITALPPSIGALTALDQLFLNGNQLTALPPAIGSLTALRRLDLSENQLTALPPAIGALTALQHLALDGNQLTALPPAIGALTALTFLDLDGNQLTELPPAIGGLTALRHFNLRENQLTALPPAIGALTALEHLSLVGNQLTELPPAIGALTALTFLDLDGNQLTALPPAIGALTALQHLDLSFNAISALPPTIGALVALEHLLLNNNWLTALPPEIGALPALRILYLGCNRLSGLPPEIGALIALEHLDLRVNQVTALPAAIGALTALKTIFLNGNQLTGLPPEIGALTALEHLSLHGNQLTEPPAEVIAQGAQAVVRFMAARLATGRALYEAKVVLVGEGAVGKTSLRSWLLDGKYREPEASTRALEIGSRVLPNPADAAQPMRINVWDFGGQDEYRPSQQLFFTPGALYLLLWKGREGLAAGKVEEWLRLIQLRAGQDARVLMISTFTGANDPQPNLNALPDDLRAMMVGQFQIDSPSGLGVAPLLDRISVQVTRLPGFGAQWPAAWLAARDAVLAIGQGGNGQYGKQDGKVAPYIVFNQFIDVCAPHGVTGEDATTLARTMSLQGRLDYHGDGHNLVDLVILSPEWLMKAIAYVISDEEETQKRNKGVLTRARLEPIWLTHTRDLKENPERYERHLWSSLLSLMDEHEIIYQLTPDAWVVAQLVPDAPDIAPERMWTIGDGADASDPQGRPALRLHCDLDYPIRGLMALLTVRNHYYHFDRHRYFWQKGVFLRHPHTLAEALVVIESENRVRIETRGQHAHDLMVELAVSLESVIADIWPGAIRDGSSPPYTFHVPCPSPGCRGRFGRTDIMYDLYEKNRETADCVGGGRHTHDIRALLHGIGAPDPGQGDYQAALNEMRIMRGEIREGFGSIRQYISSDAPRIIEIEPAPLSLDPRALTKDRYRVRIYCEETEEPVAGAEDVIEISAAWWVAMRKWIPAAVAAGKAIYSVHTGMPPPIEWEPGKLPQERDDNLAGEIGGQTGLLIRPDGQHIAADLKDRLIDIARKGGMKQIKMDSDRRWVWVSPAVARRADRSKPKEEHSAQ